MKSWLVLLAISSGVDHQVSGSQCKNDTETASSGLDICICIYVLISSICVGYKSYETSTGGLPPNFRPVFFLVFKQGDIYTPCCPTISGGDLVGEMSETKARQQLQHSNVGMVARP